jgi:diadenosine tetraphosphatase ApaH/serine/threonine PP2A family protein phosphatase
MGNIFAIGDIHGCFQQLKDLLKKIPFNSQRDQLVFLGDYIDRGEHSYDVIRFLIQLKKRLPKTVFLKGNHEAMLEDFMAGENRQAYIVNGGQKTLDSYLSQGNFDLQDPIPQSHWDFFHALELYYETDDYIFVHAGLRDGVPLVEQTPYDLLWVRDRFTQSKYDFGKRVIYGHTNYKAPSIQPNKIGIDTGAVFGRCLTCLQLPELVFFSV